MKKENKYTSMTDERKRDLLRLAVDILSDKGTWEGLIDDEVLTWDELEYLREHVELSIE